MPNWCSNDLFITGKPLAVAAVKSLMGLDKEEPTFDFNGVIEYPREFKDRDEEVHRLRQSDDPADKEKAWHMKDGFNSGGYEWCIANWGTKWGACDLRVNDEQVLKSGKVKLSLTFDTAWAPPSPVIKALAERFPECNITLRYYEMGAGFKGHESYVRGALQSQSEGTYSGNRGG